jgi:O-antigen ligase
VRIEATHADRALGTSGSTLIRATAGTAVLAGELLLLGIVWRTANPWLPVGLAIAPVYFLLAFRSPDTAWALVWLAVPFSMQRLLPGGNAIQFPTELMIALALAAWLARSLVTGRGRVAPSPLHLPLSVIAIVALLSALFGAHPMVGLKAWLAAAGYAAFGFLYFSTTSCDPARRERWVRLVAATGALWGLYGFIRVLILGVSARAGYGAARPFFGEHGTYSAYLAMVLPLALFAALERRGRARWMYGLAALMISLGIVFSFTRAAWVSLAVVLPLALGVWTVRRRTWKPLLIPGVLLLLTAIVLIGSGGVDHFSRHVQSMTHQENVSNLERLNRWMAAIEMTKERPVLGVGYGAYSEMYPHYRRKLIVTSQAFERMSAHSEPLRLLAETGVLGMLAALWLLGCAAWIGMRSLAPDRDGSMLLLASAAGVGTYVVHGIFNAYLGIDKVAVPFWSGLGLLAALSRTRVRG